MQTHHFSIWQPWLTWQANLAWQSCPAAGERGGLYSSACWLWPGTWMTVQSLLEAGIRQCEQRQHNSFLAESSR